MVNGSLEDSHIIVTGGELGGSGSLGDVTVNGGTVAPGNSIGTLTLGGDWTLGLGLPTRWN